ncbi:hypothetical protein DL768_006900 [Monosporascus sp. mg162]|nr:hypothetical protein DL768_006900 [Monosporascus sp. mg162]
MFAAQSAKRPDTKDDKSNYTEKYMLALPPFLYFFPNPFIAFFGLNEMFKASTESAYCIKAPPHVSDSFHSPFITRHGVPLWEFYEQNPDHAARFAKAMASWANGANLPVPRNDNVSVALARQKTQEQQILAQPKVAYALCKHDPFEHQPVRDAFAVIVRHVTHNWMATKS